MDSVYTKVVYRHEQITRDISDINNHCMRTTGIIPKGTLLLMEHVFVNNRTIICSAMTHDKTLSNNLSPRNSIDIFHKIQFLLLFLPMN